MLKRLVIILILLGGTFAWFQKDRILALFQEDTRTINQSEVKLIFREDPNLQMLINTLNENGIVSNNQFVKDYITDNNVDTSKFAAGKYVILSQTSMHQLIQGFLKDENGNGNAEVKVNVVFNRCKTLEDIASNIAKCILADEEELKEELLSPEVHAHYGFSKETFPGMFIPKTYEMYFDTDAKQFIRFMADRFNEYWTEERKELLTKVGLKSPSQAVTVASIVYSEQSRDIEEWPIIAKLYLNRLNIGMKLQSDPTFKYCWGDELDGVERLLNKHKNIDCPYNTYLYSGLPPGPICVPPAEVVDAVLNPADVNYLFMCGKPGGQGHNFAVSNAQHERNAAVYRKWLKEYLANKENS